MSFKNRKAIKTVKPNLPNFIVAGVPKSGTTSLYFYLKQHPDIFVPDQKELHYFSYPFLAANARGPGDADILKTLCADRKSYEHHYVSARNQSAIGEFSPSYFYYSNSASQIRNELGDVKIILMLRNPIEKAYSQYMHQVRNNLETLSFEDALDAEAGRRKKGWSDIWRYAESSLYANRLKDFMNTFGTDRIKIVVFEDFATDTDTEMKGILSFLGVDTDIFINTKAVYNRTGKPRSKLLANIVTKPNPLKAVLKRYIGERTRTWLRLKLLDINSSKKEEIRLSTRQYLEEFFQNDMTQLALRLKRPPLWDPIDS